MELKFLCKLLHRRTATDRNILLRFMKYNYNNNLQLSSI